MEKYTKYSEFLPFFSKYNHFWSKKRIFYQYYISSNYYLHPSLKKRRKTTFRAYFFLQKSLKIALKTHFSSVFHITLVLYHHRCALLGQRWYQVFFLFNHIQTSHFLLFKAVFRLFKLFLPIFFAVLVFFTVFKRYFFAFLSFLPYFIPFHTHILYLYQYYTLARLHPHYFLFSS